MRIHRAVLVGVLLGCPGFAVAENFDFQVDGGFSQFEDDFDNETTGFEVSGIWYYSGLSDAAGPRALAVFLDMASGVGLSYSTSELEVNTNADVDIDEIELSVRNVWKDSNWFVEASFGDVEADSGTISDGAQVYGLSVGHYVTPTTTIQLGFSNLDPDSSEASDEDGLSAELLHVGGLESEFTYSVGLALDEVTSFDADFGYTLNFGIYPNQDWSIAASYNGLSGADTIDVTGFSIGTSYFVSPAFAVSLEYSTTEIEVSSFGFSDSFDEDGFTINLTGRF